MGIITVPARAIMNVNESNSTQMNIDRIIMQKMDVGIVHSCTYSTESGVVVPSSSTFPFSASANAIRKTWSLQDKQWLGKRKCEHEKT